MKAKVFRTIDFLEQNGPAFKLPYSVPPDAKDAFRSDRTGKEVKMDCDIIQAMIDARNREGLTQKELSERTGITQADISRIENGIRNPSLEMVKRLARGLGMRLKLEFIPENTVKTMK